MVEVDRVKPGSAGDEEKKGGDAGKGGREDEGGVTKRACSNKLYSIWEWMWEEKKKEGKRKKEKKKIDVKGRKPRRNAKGTRKRWDVCWSTKTKKRGVQ